MEKRSLIPVIPFILALTAGALTFPPWSTLTYDGALYIDIARNLARDITDFTYQGVYMMYRPPLYPYTLSVLFRFAPLDTHLTAARLVSLLSFALTAVLVSLLARELLMGEAKAILASLFYIFNPLAFTMATRELVHSEFTLFYTLAIYLLYTGRKRGSEARIYGAFVAAGLAILTRYTGLSIIAVFLAYLWLTEHWDWVKRREYWIGFALLVLTLSPWLYMGHVYYGGAFRPFSVASRVVTLDRPVSVSDFFKLLMEDVGRVLIALAALGFLKLRKDDEGWLLISWLFMGLAGILTVTHKETRFITFLSPAIAVMAVLGVEVIADALGLAARKAGVSISENKAGIIVLVLSLLLLVPVGTQARDLKDSWNLMGKGETEVMMYALDSYPASRLLVSPRLYTVAGYYYPGASVDMVLDRKAVKERIAEGYYDLIVLREPSPHLNIEESGNYILVKEFYGGKFKLYLRKEN
ncbi:glycosyltransferase [Thermococcus siculi]|uniref:Glycosyltransferase n=1 Tax=Thermococcus siculi TaxID=72803 RepID=A0A2Z2MPV1_9EURY|nr:glycosyltransferase family 39 protein [Thermococcus siculi]ASJ08684.1 glycosyltransferase [Thermococcus siculi]